MGVSKDVKCPFCGDAAEYKVDNSGWYFECTWCNLSYGREDVDTIEFAGTYGHVITFYGTYKSLEECKKAVRALNAARVLH